MTSADENIILDFKSFYKTRDRKDVMMVNMSPHLRWAAVEQLHLTLTL